MQRESDGTLSAWATAAAAAAASSAVWDCVTRVGPPLRKVEDVLLSGVGSALAVTRMCFAISVCTTRILPVERMVWRTRCGGHMIKI